MHASTQELITLRDGQLLGADIVLHVAECKLCNAELVRLRARRVDLQRLPAFEPPPAAWSTIEQRLQRPVTRAIPGAGWSVAACAVVALAVGFFFTQSAPQLPQSAAGGAGNDPAVAELVARSQRLESILQGMPRRPAVERATTSAAIEALQSRIQALDEQLVSAADGATNSGQTRRLWSDRVQLMSSLLDVRYAEAARDGYRSIDTLNSPGAI